jgi:NADH-quinone oxidoreductase subunit J
MTLYTLIFYLIAAVILASTALAITRRNMVHAVVYLVVSFFGSAVLFYLLGAPLLAAVEVIVYAGAIMILFIFIIMMLKVEGLEERFFPLRQWLPAAGFSLIYLLTGLLLVLTDKEIRVPLAPAQVRPEVFGGYLFQHHWLAVEIVSILLLVALIGALVIGRTTIAYRREKAQKEAP